MALLISTAGEPKAPASESGTWGTEAPDTQLAVTHRFQVAIGGLSLGGWTKVSGLIVDMKPTAVKQAGVNTYTAQLLNRPEWSPLVLERPVTNNAEWTATFDYLITSLTKPENAENPKSHPHLTITMVNAWGEKLRTLTFINARPSKWEGPQLDSNSGKGNIAIEKLTLVHDGFFPEGKLE
jgi:phage tail-like protein